MKRMSIYAVALAATVSLAACGRDAGDERQTTTADRPADAGTGLGMGLGNDARDNQEFVQQALEKNLAEIELSKLAQERAANPQVRQFAQQMVEEHTKALNELRQVAQRENLQVNEQLRDEHREKQQRLQGLKGAEFDREYMSAMVEGHDEMHSLLEDRADRRGDQAATGTADRGTVGTVGQPATQPAQPGQQQRAGEPAGQAQGELNQWAARTLPVVERHHERAQELRDQLDQKGRPNR